MTGQQATISERTRLQRGWDWYTSLGLGAWLLAGGSLVVAGLVIAVVVGHGDTPSSACDDGAPYVALINRYDGDSLTSHQAARLRSATPHLQAASDSAVGTPRSVLAEAARIAASARAGQQFDAGAVDGRFRSVCDFSGPDLHAPGGR